MVGLPGGGNSRRLGDDDRERGADRDAPGDERGAPCGATRLAIPARERAPSFAILSMFG